MDSENLIKIESGVIFLALYASTMLLWVRYVMFARDHSLRTYAKFFEKVNFFYPLLRTCACADQGVRNISVSENFAYVLIMEQGIADKFAKLSKIGVPLECFTADF